MIGSRKPAASPNEIVYTARRTRKTNTSSRRPTSRWTRRAISSTSASTARYPRRDCRSAARAASTIMDVIPEAGRFRRHGDDPLPGKRRRQPRPDGLEHAASGGAASDAGGAVSSAPAWNTSAPTIPAFARWRARRGVVDKVDGRRRFRSREDKRQAATYTACIKFKRSNQGTCINQRPIWSSEGQHGEEGPDVIADGPSHRQGRDRPGPQHPHGLHDLGRLQLRGRRPAERRACARRRVHLRFISRNTNPKPATPSWGRRKSPAISPTSARTR